MASAYTLCRGNVGGVASIGRGRLLVSVQGDGVSCYDTSDRKTVASWALGSGTGQEFSSAAVYDYATNLCFAPLRVRGAGSAAGKAGQDSVLAWCPDDTGGTITQLAHPLHLPAVHRLFPLSHTPEGEEEEAAAAAEEASGVVDGSGTAKAGVLAVLASGGAALCSGAEVVAEAEAAAGQQTVATALQGNRLVVVASEPRGAAYATVYAVEGGALEQQSSVRLEPPVPGARAVAASSTPERSAVLWSDGTVAVYAVPGDKQPLLPLPAGDSRQPVAKRRLAGYRLAAAGKQKGGGSGAAAGKKRGAAAADADAAAGSPSMAAVSDKQVALAGWATSSEGVPVLRLVVLETAAACVQLSRDFAAADVGLAAFDTAKPVQAEFLGGSSLALCIGSAVLVAPLEELPKPTLANLLGALALDKALIAMRASGAGAGDGVLSAPAAAQQLLGSTVAVNPAALAAARVLHPDEIAALSDPFGGAPRPIDCRLELEEPTKPGQWLVDAKEVTWKVKDEPADAAIAAEERRVWQEVQQPAAAALGSDAAMQQLLEPLLQLRRSSGYELSPRLVASLVMLAAERGYWGTVEAIVAVQAPWLLGDVPGLAAAAADQGRIGLAAELMQCTADVPAAELAAVLGVLLSPPSSEAAAAGRQARHAAAAAAVAAAEEAAQQAAAGVPPQQQQQQQQQQEQQEGLAAAGKPGRRRRGRKRGGSDAGAAEKAAAAAEGGEDSDSDVEDLTAIEPAFYEPGAERSRGGAPAAGPDDQALAAAEQPGEREAAVATCCRAAVEGFSADDVCLHTVVALPLRQAVLLVALRSLSGTQAVQLLRYLAATLRRVAAMVGTAADGWVPPLQLPRGTALPSLAQLAAWSSALIDSCLVKLSLEPESHALASQMAELAAAQAEEIRPLLKLPGMVEHVLQLAARPKPAGATADYSVQWLDLRVLPAEVREREARQRAAEAVSGGLVLPKAQQAAAQRAAQQAQQQAQQQEEQE